MLTHALVFLTGVGLAAAVFHSASTPDERAENDPLASGDSAGDHSVLTGSGHTTGRPGQRERRDGDGRASGKNGDSAADRMAGIVRMGDPLARQTALLEMLNKLGPGDFEAVAESWRSLDHFGQSGGEFEMILRSWARVDPLAALDYTANRQKDRGAASVVLSAWAARDAAGAETWALANHSGDGPNPYLTAVIRGVAAYDIAHAMRLTESMPANGERRDAVREISRALFVQGMDVAADYPNSIADPKLRAEFVDQIGNRMAEKDPVQAGTWLAAMNNADDQNRAARRVGEALASRDPQAAADWMRKLQPAAQAEAARGIIPKMSSQDIVGTAQWVNTLSGIPNYDRVVEEFVWSCDYRAPEQSAAWIRGVADPERQARLYHQMLGEWAKRDAAAVKSWVASNQVPESVFKRFGR